MDNTIQNLHQLRSFNLDFYNDDVVEEFYPKHSPQKFLQLSSALSKLTQIRKLYLNNTQCINDDTLNSTSRACHYIHTLEFSCTDDITDIGLFYLCRLEHLANLNLEACHSITDEGIKMLAQLGHLCNLD